MYNVNLTLFSLCGILLSLLLHVCLLSSLPQNMLAGLGELLDVAKDVLDVLVNDELQGWTLRQQRACIGAPDDTSLEQLEKWYTHPRQMAYTHTHTHTHTQTHI